MSLELAQIKRQENALAKIYNYNGEVVTLETLIIRNLESGSKLVTGQEPVIKYDRVKFNRMNQREQDVYNKRLAQTKTFYRVEDQEGSGFDIPKLVYYYFLDKGSN